MSSSARSKINRYYERFLKEKEREEAKGASIVSGDAVEFCLDQLEFKPTAYQENLLRDPSQFIVARWSRQSGKSQTIAALTLFRILSCPGSRVAILAPSLRQSRKIITKIRSFLPKLPPWILDGKPLKTKLDFFNESTIKALPNSPETIRGETLNMVVIDELGFVPNDDELYDAVVYSLGTTDGKFVGASTPGSRDSLFYAMCTDDERFRNVSRHHVSYREALEPNGPLKKKILEEIQQQMLQDPWRWRREMEAEFAEDEDSWFPLALITKCVSDKLTTFPDQEVLTGQLSLAGSFFAGTDLGQKRDFSVIALVEKKDRDVYLLHLKQFNLGTEYGSVLGYLKLLNERCESIRRILIDQTGVGEVFVEETIKSGLKNAQGIMLSLPKKQEVMVYLKQLMQEGRLHIPYETELINEMNVERFELTKTGQMQFSHPDGTHDDRLWALALAVYASRPEVPEYHPVVLRGKSSRLNLPSQNRQWSTRY